MKTKLISTFMVLSLMVSMGITALATNETDVDQFGNSAPKLTGVKWLLAPTVVSDYPDSLYPHGYSVHSRECKMSVVDRFGKAIIPLKYPSVSVYETHLCAKLSRLVEDNSTAIFEINGKQITEHLYAQTVPSCYYVNEDGRYLKVVIYDSNGNSFETYVNLDTAKELPRMRAYGQFKDGLVGFTSGKNECGFSDTKGNISYAPKEYTYINPIGPSTLFYEKKSNGVKYMGICDLNFKSLVEIEEENGDFDYQTNLLVVDKGEHESIYDTDGTILVESSEDYKDSDIDAHGKRYVEFFKKTPGWDVKYRYYVDSKEVVYADDLPEGYYIEGVLVQTAAPLATEGTIGVKDSSGNWVVPKNFIDIKRLPGSDGHVVICRTHDYTYDVYDLHTSQKLCGGFKHYMQIGDFVRAEFPRSNSKAKTNYTFLNRMGKQLIKAYDEVGVSNVIVAHNWGDYKNIVCDVYDLNGNLLRSESKYKPNGSLNLNNGGLSVITTSQIDGLYGYCDSKFDEVIPCVFDYCLDFVEGQAWVKYQGKWGIIDNPLDSTAETYWANRTKPSQDLTAVKTTASVVVDGKHVAFDAYNIDGNNYFKLRDIAKVVSGTQKQFDVSWDNTNKAINLLSGAAYTVVGGELATGTGASMKATANTSPILKDKLAVKLSAYNIGGNNYFKLRDLGQAFNFAVTWDGATNSINIDTSKGYTG